MHWQVQQAKQRFSEVLRAAERDGPQYVTRHGLDVAVVLSVEDFDKLRPPDEPKPSFLEHLLAMPKLTDEEWELAWGERPNAMSGVPFEDPDAK